MTAMPASSREEQLEAVPQAALYLLGARQDQTLSIGEWTDLARAVATCQQRKTAEYLAEHDLQDIAETYVLEWDDAVDGPLPAVPNLDE